MGKNFCDQPVKSSVRTHENIRKIATDQGDDYTTGCPLDYNYFNNHYKMIVIDSSKQQELDTDPKAIHKINFTENMDQAASAAMLSLLKKRKKPFYIFHKELLKYCECVPQFHFVVI